MISSIARDGSGATRSMAPWASRVRGMFAGTSSLPLRLPPRPAPLPASGSAARAAGAAASAPTCHRAAADGAVRLGSRSSLVEPSHARGSKPRVSKVARIVSESGATTETDLPVRGWGNTIRRARRCSRSAIAAGTARSPPYLLSPSIGGRYGPYGPALMLLPGMRLEHHEGKDPTRLIGGPDSR